MTLLSIEPASRCYLVKETMHVETLTVPYLLRPESFIRLNYDGPALRGREHKILACTSKHARESRECIVIGAHRFGRQFRPVGLACC
jgi:hypothetical protein